MVSMITSANAHILTSPLVSVLGLGTNLKINTRAALLVVKQDSFWGFKELKKTKTRSGILCKLSLESESDFVLEKQILEFMKISTNPNDFPTKKDLLDAGRIDLVDAIIKKGGWLSLGWDDSDDENGLDIKEVDDVIDSHTTLDNQSLSSCSSSHQFASSSGRSVERVIREDAGIEGILLRLEKHRRSLSLGKDNVDVKTNCDEKSNRGEEDSNDFNCRLQQMKLELSSTLCLLRSGIKTLNPEGHKSSSNELQRLSDNWEFQENEIMHAKDRLRSLRAELAVLEGKMTLSITNAQKIVEAKQRRLDGGYRALKLHTACIIWPNSASDVLLVGSFDGWTTQRKMERSQTGVFSLSLKLYPGRYEIKFIVDGVWRIDTLRPIINNNGYENNVLIVHES